MDIIRELLVTSAVIGNLPELPGYNGSILQIDDTEVETIQNLIDRVIVELEKLRRCQFSAGAVPLE